MSSAHEEADDGPVYEDSEEGLPNNVDVQDFDDGSGHERFTTRPQQAQQPRGPAQEEEEGDMSIGDHTPSKNGIHIGDERLRGSIISRGSTPEIGRPSSADGSFSIPDDTPSVQVSNGIDCQPLELMSLIIGFFNLLTRQTRSFICLWAKSHPLIASL